MLTNYSKYVKTYAIIAKLLIKSRFYCGVCFLYGDFFRNH